MPVIDILLPLLFFDLKENFASIVVLCSVTYLLKPKFDFFFSLDILLYRLSFTVLRIFWPAFIFLSCKLVICQVLNFFSVTNLAFNLFIYVCLCFFCRVQGNHSLQYLRERILLHCLENKKKSVKLAFDFTCALIMVFRLQFVTLTQKCQI